MPHIVYILEMLTGKLYVRDQNRVCDAILPHVGDDPVPGLSQRFDAGAYRQVQVRVNDHRHRFPSQYELAEV